ncbi:motility-associated protein [Photobacterium kishitanii]|uniref:motility-associated protein n=1 Tax=Photobacterium kishitanii TaxID=318456 RepID=UPI0005D35C33|nr:hypothetical protein UA40_14805 [Photobacterium kishitanii]
MVFFINGGHLGLLWHPGEFVIIFGSAVTIFLISNPIETVKQTGLSLKSLIKPLYTEEKNDSNTATDDRITGRLKKWW